MPYGAERELRCHPRDSSDEHVARLAKEVGGEPIDQLWCNAGIISREGLDDLDIERIRQQVTHRTPVTTAELSGCLFYETRPLLSPISLR